jgi:hypothetical protein
VTSELLNIFGFFPFKLVFDFRFVMTFMVTSKPLHIGHLSDSERPTNKPIIFNCSSKVLSRAINFGRQCHFKIWLDCHKFKKFPCLIMPMSTKCQKNENKMTINIIQHDDRL